jgi:hypothetical protein
MTSVQTQPSDSLVDDLPAGGTLVALAVGAFAKADPGAKSIAVTVIIRQN